VRDGVACQRAKNGAQRNEQYVFQHERTPTQEMVGVISTAQIYGPWRGRLRAELHRRGIHIRRANF
jgi:hypothetical protein